VEIAKHGFADIQEGYKTITTQLIYAVRNGTLEEEIHRQADENDVGFILEAKVNSTALVVDPYEVVEASPTSVPTSPPSALSTTRDQQKSKLDIVAGITLAVALFMIYYLSSVITGLLRIGRIYFSQVLLGSVSSRPRNFNQINVIVKFYCKLLH
jgi:hypothetical protein